MNMQYIVARSKAALNLRDVSMDGLQNGLVVAVF